MTQNPIALAPGARLNGDSLRAMVTAATTLFQSNVEAINALNVFPVPDGDTGTNMFLTLQEVLTSANEAQTVKASDVADAMAKGALVGARGNSGVILSQFFKGLAIGFENKADFGVEDLTNAFCEAKEQAYNAVGNPVEGTLLTVIRDVSDAAQGQLSKGIGFHELYDVFCEAARKSVARTPIILPVLREAGVVDAGGQGFYVLLEGFRRWIKDENLPNLEIVPPRPLGLEEVSSSVAVDFIEATDEETYGYCTQFIIEGQSIDTNIVRTQMNLLAKSAVVIGDDTLIKVHVHTDDPGPILTAAVARGRLAQVSIQNMDEQHVEFSAARRLQATSLPMAVVAIALGRGFEELFINLGASSILSGGDTMNPSVNDILEIVAKVPSESVIILPNNRNIIPAANQAAELANKTVFVVPTTSMPQGVAAMLSLNQDQDVESNVIEMKDILDNVSTGEITEASRPVVLNKIEVKPGNFIGLLNHELVASDKDLLNVVEALLRKANLSGENLVTLYSGALLGRDKVEEMVSHLRSIFLCTEFEVFDGGQPHYHFIISIE